MTLEDCFVERPDGVRVTRGSWMGYISLRTVARRVWIVVSWEQTFPEKASLVLELRLRSEDPALPLAQR
jgi:hypothetical protein